MKTFQVYKNIKDSVYFDRMIAKGNLSHTLLVILLLPLVLTIAWLMGVLIEHILNLFNLHITFDCIKDGILWETYENYINPSVHPGSSFSHRLFMLLTGIIGIFLLNGILVSAIVSWVENRTERWKAGELHYDKKRWFQKNYALTNFVVVIGGNEMVPELVRQLLCADKTLFVLIMTNRDVPSLRKRLVSILKEDEERVVIYHGERTFIDDLSHLQIERANSIYVIGEQLDIEQSGSHHDVKNMECVKLMSQLLNNIKENTNDTTTSFSPILCRVMFEYQSSFSVFQFTDVNNSISSVLDFRPFNYYEAWAQNVLICPTLTPNIKTDDYLPLEGSCPISYDSEDIVHLIVVGMSRMGIALGIEAAHIAHYPNFIKNGKLRTKITFIDSVAKKEMQLLQGHYKEVFALSRWKYIEATDKNIFYRKSRRIFYDTEEKTWHDPLKDADSQSPYRDKDNYTLGEKIVDIDWEFIQGDLEMPAIQDYIRDAAQREHERLTIAICFPKDNASYAASLYLPDEVYEENNNVVQVLVYQPYGDAMCQSFKNRIEMKGNIPENHRNNFNLFLKLKAFGMMNSCYNIVKQQKMELAAEQLSQQYSITYEGRIGGRNSYRKKLGVDVALTAGKSMAAKQWSNNYAAAHLWTKLRSINWDGQSNIDMDNLTILAQLEHIRWNTEQLLLGYAPLLPEEQESIKEKLHYPDNVEFPNDELMQLSLNKEKIDPTQFTKLKKWLEAWKYFDEEREILKANMSHIDLCSYEVLEKIDKEAIKYDDDLTQILPLIYNRIKEIYDRPSNHTRAD